MRRVWRSVGHACVGCIPQKLVQGVDPGRVEARLP